MVRYASNIVESTVRCLQLLLLVLPFTTGSVAIAGERDAPVSSARAIMKIPDNGGATIVHGLRVALNKSVLIELPRDVQDVLVASPGIVDAVVHSSRRINLIGKTVGQSNAIFSDAEGRHVLALEILVEQDVSSLSVMLDRLIPGSNIEVETIRDSIVLTGAVRTPSDAIKAVDLASRFIAHSSGSGGNVVRLTRKQLKESIVNMLTVEAEEQVMLQVKVVEVQRSVLKQFGINLGALINSGNFVTGFLAENALPLTAAAGLGTLPLPGITTTGDPSGLLQLFNKGPQGAGDPVGSSGIVGAWTTPKNRITHALRALERDGLVRTLAEPNLTAVSGESAKFLAGGEFPIPIVDTQGKTSVIFKEFGVGVLFTPVVLSEGRISLNIETEVSELSNQGAVQISGISIPALNKRQAKSTVELPSGGSLAIAGLLSDKIRQNIDGLPGMKDVPVLGSLFRSRDFIKEESELVVIVTPYVVRPVHLDKLAKPDDGFAPATDLRAILLGRLNRVYDWQGDAPLANYDGDVGFILK